MLCLSWSSPSECFGPDPSSIELPVHWNRCINKKINNFVVQNNYYHVLPKRFHLNDHIIGFLSQTQKLDQYYKPPSFSLVYLPTISESNAFSSCHDWNSFLMIFRRLTKVAENVRRSSDGLFNDNILVSCDKKRLFGLFFGILNIPENN